MTHWSCRTLAKSQGVSKSTIHNIWQAHNLKPHRVKTFKLSRDPKFLEKLTDVIGLYLNPPQQAIVLCVDEKSQIQALDRTQPGLPLKKGRCGTMTHDYKRNGTTTLFAALETLQGKVIGQCYPRHRHQEFLKFLRTLDKELPGDVPLHLILDNYGTHKHEKVRGWLKAPPALRDALCADQFQLAEPGRAVVRRTDSEGDPPRVVRQRGGVEGLHGGIPGGLERGAETLRLGGDGRIHHGETLPLSAHFGADSARFQQPAAQKTEEMTVHLFRGHYH